MTSAARVAHPWYVRALLVDPDRVLANLSRARDAGVVDELPNAWQLGLGVLRLWTRVLLRSETVGTSPAPVRATWRARVLANRAARLPFLLATGAVRPFDFTGLRGSADELIEHVLGAHHDRRQIIYDLELLAAHGALPALIARARAIVEGRDPRATWLRDLAVFIDYHEEVLAAAERAERAITLSPEEARDPDLSLRGFVAWCAHQPATPRATFARYLRGEAAPASVDTLAEATPSELAARMATGHPVAPAQLADAVYRGTSLGLPAWVDRIAWKTFAKVFVRAGDEVRGWNVRIDQRTQRPRTRGGAPVTFGHFVVRDAEPGVVLDYGVLRDPLVALEPGSSDHLLGRSWLVLANRWLPTPSYFVLERER